MIKGLKRISMFLFLICFSVIFYFVNNGITSNAEGDQETKLSEYAIRVGDLETRNLMGGVKLYKERVKTTYNGVHTGIYDINNKKYEYSHNTVQWVELPKSNDAVRVVSWSKGSVDGWAASTVRTTAMDFEEKNPGWIVVAAVNGDSFDINGTKEPAKLHVQDGEVYQPNVGYTQIGWKKDDTPIINGATVNSVLQLEVLDKNKNVIKNANINTVNTTPSETGISILTKDCAGEYDLTGFKVYVGKYDACRISKYTGQIFVKGEIQNVRTDLGANSKPINKNAEREFFLISKDGSLDSLIEQGSYVRCQHSLTGEWADVPNVLCGFGGSAGGLNSQVLKDGNPLGAGSTDSFAYTTHPRTVVGFKEDGSTVLMVGDGRGKAIDYEQGLSYFQEGEIMRLAGCTHAYNLDGGGSSTLIVRNAYGNFDVINRPSDGSERHIGNAILFVMKDPGINWDVKNTTRNSVSFTLGGALYSSEIQNAKITIDGKTAEMVNGVATVEGLQEDTEYVATIEYSAPAYDDPTKLIKASYTVDVKTKAFEMPSLGIVFEDISKTSVRVVKRQSDTSSWFRDIVIHMNDGEYVMGSNDELLIEDLPENTKFDVEITFNCVEPTTGNVYPGKIKKTVTTLSYNVPTISKFIKTQEKNNRVTIEYKYVDDDELVMSAVLKVNDEDIPLTTKTGIQTIKDLDLEHQEYKIQLVVTYVVGTTAKNVKSEIITVGTNNPIISHNITYNLDGGTNNELNPSSYVEGEEVILKEATKEGYKFIGWYIGETKVTSISPEAKEDIELTAKWEKIKEKYQITYILNGGTNNASNPSTYEEGEKVILKEATKEGYKFLGWYKDGELVTEVKEGNVTVEARFEEIKNQDSEKKGCNCKKTIEMVITLTSAVTLLAFVLRKKH